MARTGEGRHSPRDRGDRQRGLGPLGQERRASPCSGLLADLEPQQIVDAIDFRYIEDALSPAEALEILSAMQPGRKDVSPSSNGRAAIPAYTTSAGWLGYGEEKIVELAHEARRRGLHAREDEGRRRTSTSDARRAALIRGRRSARTAR